MKKHLAEIWNAEDVDHARRAVKEFEAAYGIKHPKAVAKVLNDLAALTRLPTATSPASTQAERLADQKPLTRLKS